MSAEPVVVDASVVVKWYVEEPDAEAARRLLQERPAFLAPDLLWCELASAFRAKVRRGSITSREALMLLGAALDAAVETVPTRELTMEAGHLALQLSHPIYDCMYLALAIREGIALATADRWLAAALHHHPALRRRVELITSA